MEHQSEMYPLKKGKLAKDQNERLILVNESGNAYSTNDAILVIWQLCSGEKTVLEICSDLKEHSSEPDFKDKVIFIFDKLKNANLIDYKQSKF